MDLRADCSPPDPSRALTDIPGFPFIQFREWWARHIDQHPQRFSPLFLWTEARRKEHTVTSGVGCFPRSFATVLTHIGVVPEDDWPLANNLYTLPPAEVEEHAAAYRLTDAYYCAGLADVLQSLAEGYPVIIGFGVPMEWSSVTTGSAPLPSPDSPVIGNTALLAVGYDLWDDTLLTQTADGFLTLPLSAIHDNLWSAWTFREEAKPVKSPAPKATGTQAVVADAPETAPKPAPKTATKPKAPSKPKTSTKKPPSGKK